ncbi:transcription factor bHLH18-like [Neltuma alba]|uniref:transcription factor bHLH18-like n=1 Tax=Neltuma alba TaxID=207710 RepID=UPI0010A3764C|nr:transcription factor bHLH18-like [Prosopis alba]
MESMEESWESLFQDLAIAGDFSFAFGAHELLGSASHENFGTSWNNNNNNTDTFNSENGIITSNPSSSNSVFMLQDKASFDDPSKGYLQIQTRIKERGMAEGRNTREQDHLLAERIRRGKITQHFIALSALIPGLKRADKASVLEGAIKHVKQLQEQVKILEEQTKKKTGESLVFVKKSQLISTDMSFNNSSDNIKNFLDPSESHRTVAEADVEARVSDKNVLIRVQCEKQEGIMVKTIKEIEKFHLSVVNSSVMPFGTSILDITIIAEMEDEFNLGGKELARNLRMALSQSM